MKNRLDDYWQPLDDAIDHPPCDCLRESKQHVAMALANLEAAEQVREGNVAIRRAATADLDAAKEQRRAAAVDRDAAEKKLEDAKYVNRNTSKLLKYLLLALVAHAVLVVARSVT